MGTLEHPRPEGLLHNPGFSQVVAASGRRTIYTAGQVSIDEHGALLVRLIWLRKQSRRWAMSDWPSPPSARATPTS
jgi:hypothetical protein